jgi:hypothetical protein
LIRKTDERKQPRDGGAALRKAIPGVGCGDGRKELLGELRWLH